MASFLGCFLILVGPFPSLLKVLFALGSVLVFTLRYWVENSDKPIVSLEAMGWSWSSFLGGLQANFILSCVLASISGAALAIFTGDSARVLAVFVFVLITSALYWGVAGGLQPKKMIDPSSRPNHGIHQSAKVIATKLVFISLLYAVVGAFAGILLARANGMSISIFPPGLVPLLGSPLAAIVGSGVVFGCMGLGCGWILTDPHMILGHLSLRFLLARSSRAPLNLVRFLDFCEERLILKRVGGSYVFFHRLLLDYYAALPVLSRDCRLDHAAEEIAAWKRRLLVPFSPADQHYELASAFLRQGDLPQATHHFRVRLGLRPKDGLGPNVYLGVLAWHAGQTESALQAFESALRVYDSSKKSGNLRASFCLELRSCALLGLGRVEEAESALRQALACRSAKDGLPLAYMWRLLQSCEHPPQGLERLTALLSSP